MRGGEPQGVVYSSAGDQVTGLDTASVRPPNRVMRMGESGEGNKNAGSGTVHVCPPSAEND